MSHHAERAKTRLDNLHAIEPLLGALRTISMGAWHLAQNKIDQMQRFEHHYHDVLNAVLPEIKDLKDLRKGDSPTPRSSTEAIIVLVGTERGLCGRFNENLVENATNWLADQSFSSYELWALGSRMQLALERKGLTYTQSRPMPASKIVSYPQAYLMTQSWLAKFEDFEFDQFTLAFNQTQRGGKIEFSTYTLLPYEIDPLAGADGVGAKRWPPPIIETDPAGIYRQIIQHIIAASFYQVLLKSAIAEHSFRYRMMEEAKQNADEIIAELKRVINAERRRKITQEMQELAVGAGLIDKKI